MEGPPFGSPFAAESGQTVTLSSSVPAHRMADHASSTLQASVVIPTFNRAAMLGATLARIAETRTALRAWDVVVVDNNSRDDTRAVVARAARGFPVPLRYVFEPAQGRSHALNSGIAATSAPAIVFTDDDVVVADGWIDAAVGPLAGGQVDYTGGPVRPIWEAPCPTWLSADRSDLWGTIAILDYGPEPFVFEDRKRVPLGANMAVRRSLLERIGGFSTRLGRTSGRQLLGQEVPEFLARSRAVGARGLYVPTMVVDHHVPARRLTKDYFRRWWFGKGLSRAQLDALQPINELGDDLSKARRVCGVPLFMIRSALDDLYKWTISLDPRERFRREAMLCFFAGYVRARLMRIGLADASVAPTKASVA